MFLLLTSHSMNRTRGRDFWVEKVSVSLWGRCRFRKVGKWGWRANGRCPAQQPSTFSHTAISVPCFSTHPPLVQQTVAKMNHQPVGGLPAPGSNHSTVACHTLNKIHTCATEVWPAHICCWTTLPSPPWLAMPTHSGLYFPGRMTFIALTAFGDSCPVQNTGSWILSQPVCFPSASSNHLPLSLSGTLLIFLV